MKKIYEAPSFEYIKVLISSDLMNNISQGEGNAGNGSVENPGEEGFE